MTEENNSPEKPDKQEVKRDSRGRFLPGCSGNPAGRPPRRAEDIRQAYEPYEEEARQLLVEIMRNPDVPASTRLKAVNRILSYAHGNPRAIESENPIQEVTDGIRELRKLLTGEDGDDS